MRKQSDAKTWILYTDTGVCQRQNLDGLNLLFRVGFREAAEPGPSSSSELVRCRRPIRAICQKKRLIINEIEVTRTGAAGGSESVLAGIRQHP